MKLLHTWACNAQLIQMTEVVHMWATGSQLFNLVSTYNRQYSFIITLK